MSPLASACLWLAACGVQRLMGGKIGNRGKVLLNRHFCTMTTWPQEVVGWGWTLTHSIMRTFEASLPEPSISNSLVVGCASARRRLHHSPLSPFPSYHSHVCLPSPFPGRSCTSVGSLSKHPQVDITTIISTSCPWDPYTCNFYRTGQLHLLPRESVHL